MKVEVTCGNEGCATFGKNQLIRCESVGVQHAYDDDNNALECAFCGNVLLVTQLSQDSAQFPLGKTHMSPLAVQLAAGMMEEDDQILTAAKIYAELVACHVSGKGLAAEYGDQVELEGGSIVTQHVVNGELVWVLTNSYRTETNIMLAREYPFN